MKRFICILSLLLCLALPALAEGLLPELADLTGAAPISREQLILDSHAATKYTGPAEAITPAVNAYLAKLPQSGLKQQLCLPMPQADCTITLYAFSLADSSLPTLTCADADLGWVVSDTHLLLDLRVYPDGSATVEILCRPELLSDAATGTPSADEGDAACTACNGRGAVTRDCAACSGRGQTHSRCASCGGDGQRNCSSCGGDGHRKCSSCSGSGHHGGSHHGGHHSKSCSSCGGDGQRRCSSCSGSGHRSCSSCGGHGKSSTRCGDCSGSGQRRTQCGVCGGSGCKQ